MDSDRAADAIEVTGEKRRRDGVVKAHPRPEDDDEDREGENGIVGRGGQEKARGRRQSDRGQNDPAFSEPISEDAARELRERIRRPHPGERKADGSLRNRELGGDLRDDGTDDESGDHRRREGERTQRERDVSVLHDILRLRPGRNGLSIRSKANFDRSMSGRKISSVPQSFFPDDPKIRYGKR